MFFEKCHFWKVKKLEGHICWLSEARRIQGREWAEKKRRVRGFYKWYANGANLSISGKFDPLFHALALAYFRAQKNKIE